MFKIVVQRTEVYTVILAAANITEAKSLAITKVNEALECETIMKWDLANSNLSLVSEDTKIVNYCNY